MLAENILDTIGNTPHVRLKKLFPNHQVWIKLEKANPGGSIKDRIALGMVQTAEKSGQLKADTVIIEPTSGNTGIGLALIAAVKNYRLILVMPETMTVERRRYMKALGAKIVLTPKEGGMTAAIEKAKELVRATPNAWMPMQFSNQANPEIHRQTTAQEILHDFTDGLDYLITGVGTGGHITGCAEVLKQHFPRLKVLAVEPEKSSVIAGGSHTPHKIQGIGAGFIPEVLNKSILDGTVAVSEEAAIQFTQRAALEEGLFLGLSSGASLAAVAQSLLTITPDKRVLTFCYDTGERYLSMPQLFPED